MIEGAVIGWRRFNLNHCGGSWPEGGLCSEWHIRATNPMGQIFVPGENVAECRTSTYGGLHMDMGHQAADPRCTCGFYVYKGLSWAARHEAGGVLGAVVCWGRITEYTHGFRAQYMEIIALGRTHSTIIDEGPLRDQAKALGVPLLSPAELDDPKRCPVFEHGVLASEIPHHDGEVQLRLVPTIPWTIVSTYRTSTTSNIISGLTIV